MYKRAAIPFQFAQLLPLFELPINEQPTVLNIERNDGGRNEEFLLVVKDDVGLLGR